MNIRINGQLSRWKSPELYVVFKDLPEKRFKTVIDTGAYDCHVRRDLLNELNIKSDGRSNLQHPIHGPVDTPNYNLSFMFYGFEEYSFNEKFCLMVTHFPYTVILGSNFLSKCKEFHYYGSENQFELLISNS